LKVSVFKRLKQCSTLGGKIICGLPLNIITCAVAVAAIRIVFPF